MEGGGQPVLSFEQCLFYFVVFLCFLRSLLGALVLSFACSSPAGGMLFGVSGLLLLLLLLFTVDEIIAAIKNINRRASPGVYGIPTQCIKEAWVFDDKGKGYLPSIFWPLT